MQPTNRVTDPTTLTRPPRYATRRNPTLSTRGGKIGVLAAAMGRPLLPHQQYIVDVATELNPPGSRLKYRYQLVVISLPRQTGKTTLARPTFLERCMSVPGVQAFMTAQMGKDATDRWNDLVSDLDAIPALKHHLRLHKSKGSEKCRFPNGSYIAPFAPHKDSLHGSTPQLVLVDEGWAFTAEQGADLMRAIRPAQITKTDRQLWIISAAGDASSQWWDALVKAGRESVSDPSSKMAYFEWSADPALDPYDPATWEFHPGLDGLITIDDLAEEAKPENNSHSDFLRGFMNRSTGHADTMLIDPDLLAAKQRDYTEPIRMADCHLAYDVSQDGLAASVYAAYLDHDNTLNVVLTRTDENPSYWLTDYLDHLLRTTPPASISADDGGLARVTTDALRQRGHHIDTLDGKTMSTAWQTFKTYANHRDVMFWTDDTPTLPTAISLAVETTHGDTTTLSRRRSLGPIDALIAATVAAWQATHTTTDIGIW